MGGTLGSTQGLFPALYSGITVRGLYGISGFKPRSAAVLLLQALLDVLLIKVNGKNKDFGIGRKPDSNSDFAASKLCDPGSFISTLCDLYVLACKIVIHKGVEEMRECT